MSSGGGHGEGGLQIPFFHAFHEFIEGSNGKAGFILPGPLLIILFFGIALIFSSYAPTQSAAGWNMALALSPLWLPILLGRFALLRYRQATWMKYNYENPFVLLEIKIPREVLKSPVAMETVFKSLNIGPGEGTWMKKYVWGRTRPWWSLEIASFGGEVHMYIYTRTNMRRAVESHLYAQYPEIEIIEAIDYSRLRDPSHDPYKMFACEFQTSDNSVMPISTYVDFDLDKPGIKPELQVNPLAQVFEFAGSLRQGEELWIQMIIRWTKKEKYRGKKKPDGKLYEWKDELKEIVEDLKKKSINKRQSVDADGHVVEVEGFPNPTKGTQETIAAIEKKIYKNVYDVGMRAIYSAPKESWEGLNPFVSNLFKPFGITVNGSLWSEKFNSYPWEDPGGKREAHENHEVVEFFRRRAYFLPPYRGPWMTLSTEELATIFHIPSSIVKTPTLPRIQSTTAAPPPNLPQ